MVLIAGGLVPSVRHCTAPGFGSAGLGPDSDILYTLMPGRTLGWEIEEFADQLRVLFGRPVDLVSHRALHHRLPGAQFRRRVSGSRRSSSSTMA